MDHVIAPLDPDHLRAVSDLARDVAGALAIDPRRLVGPPHLTIASYTGLVATAATTAVERAVRTTAPLTVRAHGYGVFVGGAPSALSLHVIVVRTRALDDLHERVHSALEEAGAEMDGLTRPSVWTPHITVVDRHLDPQLLGAAVEVLARRPHRSWSIRVRELVVSTGGRSQPAVAGVLPLEG